MNARLQKILDRHAAEVARLQQILDRPEDRARYSLQFYCSFMDSQMNKKALDRFQEFMNVIEYNAEPYELY